jgi:uncharacterized delta-60 repeat protein
MDTIAKISIHLALLSLLVVLCPMQDAQAWAVEEWTARHTTYGYYCPDHAHAIEVDSEGNVYVTGRGFSAGTSYDYTTIKYNSDGDSLWMRIYDSPSGTVDGAYALALDPQADVFVTGYSYGGSGNQEDCATVKYSTDGDEMWVERYNGPASGGDCGHALATDDHGNVYVAATSTGFGTSSDIVIIKYDTDGNHLWEQRYDGPANSVDYPIDIIWVVEGYLYVGGGTYTNTTAQDFLTLKYTEDGEFLWSRLYDGPDNYEDYANAMAVDQFQNVYLTGYTVGPEMWSDPDAATVKYNASGDLMWARIHEGPSNSYDSGEAIEVDLIGNVHVAGTTGDYYSDFLILKYNPSGDIVWAASYNSPEDDGDYAEDMVLDSAGNVYITGMSSGDETHADYCTVKFSSSGELLWDIRYNGPADQNDTPVGIALDAAENVFITGSSLSLSTSLDYLTIKYSQAQPHDLDIALMPYGPPIQIPASGAPFGYILEIENIGTTTEILDVWGDVILPDSSQYGPLFGPYNRTFDPDFYMSRNCTQNVPGNAPAGMYTYHAYIGNFPDDVWDSDSFPFEKLGEGDGSNGWFLTYDSSELIGTEVEPSPSKECFSIKIAPNPFNLTTAINFQLSAFNHVSLKIYDVAGRQVAELVNGWRDAGEHEVTFDASGLPSGVFIYTIQTKDYNASGKMVLLK